MKKEVLDALKTLRINDAFLLESDVHERTIGARLACYLAPHFPTYDVDVEYNRHGLASKRVNLPVDCGGGGDKLIVPDVIVHKRNNDDDNLLVIQIKKKTNHEPRECDRVIVEAMMQYFHYTCGLLIELPAGKGAAEREPELKWLERVENCH
ncbi:MAG TPA: hypothetical protein VNE63_04475 [Candidatus Acidoferrales bacterium]|nr:hypothetical protein [Candidatus Acidoferrales bacterium]